MSETKPIGPEITKFLRLKAKITKLNKQVNDLKIEATELEKQLIIKMEEMGTIREDVKLGSVTYDKKTVFSVKDWKKVWAFIKDTGNETLLQKRLNQEAITELFEDGIKIDGVQKGTKKKLNPGFKKGV